MNLRDKRTILYLVYIVIIVAVIIGVFLIFRPSRANAPTSSHNPAGQATSKADTNKMVITGVTSTPGNSPVTNTTLNNTGPGDILGLFVAVSGLGAWLWRRKQLRSM